MKNEELDFIQPKDFLSKPIYIQKEIISMWKPKIGDRYYTYSEQTIKEKEYDSLIGKERMFLICDYDLVTDAYENKATPPYAYDVGCYFPVFSEEQLRKMIEELLDSKFGKLIDEDNEILYIGYKNKNGEWTQKDFSLLDSEIEIYFDFLCYLIENNFNKTK